MCARNINRQLGDNSGFGPGTGWTVRINAGRWAEKNEGEHSSRSTHFRVLLAPRAGWCRTMGDIRRIARNLDMPAVELIYQAVIAISIPGLIILIAVVDVIVVVIFIMMNRPYALPLQAVQPIRSLALFMPSKIWVATLSGNPPGNLLPTSSITLSILPMILSMI